MDNENINNDPIQIPDVDLDDNLSDVVRHPRWRNKTFYERWEQLDLQAELFMRSLEKNMWIIAKACEETKFSRQFHYYNMKTNPMYRARFENLVNRCIDYVETALYKKIKEWDTTAIIFYLRNMWGRRWWNDASKEIAKETAPRITVAFRPKENNQLPSWENDWE